jgi:hypothetical protein
MVAGRLVHDQRIPAGFRKENEQEQIQTIYPPNKATQPEMTCNDSDFRKFHPLPLYKSFFLFG